MVARLGTGGIQTILVEKVSAEADDVSDERKPSVWLNGVLDSNRNVICHARMPPVPEPHERHPSVHGLSHVSVVPISWPNKQQVISESRRERQKSLRWETVLGADAIITLYIRRPRSSEGPTDQSVTLTHAVPRKAFFFLNFFPVRLFDNNIPICPLWEISVN